MGVPKFYRWTSERYPCLSQVVREHQIPEFDNLYLDMNGIIHVCSHPNDDDPHFRISEADVFKNIFHYIEVLFRTIKPQRNFFMAVDGVAPRAKMNQQRGRRFRTAKEAEDNIRRALQKGEKLPSEERFDSNCITPGTEFMARLNNHLQYFVNRKVSSDPLWQKCNIYLSGHDVPGEGEHKIMDFIRYEKSKDDYDTNTRHCLYGLDADLIMLGLVSHEPHFSLLREEVRFGKQSKRVTKPEETVFHLLHLSLMREYLEFEFSELKGKLNFGFDLERIIDDWVLLGFLVGNDFIPNLPNMHINHDALPSLYKVYIDTMPKLDGYLHDSGFLNLPRFQKYLEALSKFDRDRFEDVYADMKWLEGRTGRSVSPAKRKGNGKKGKKFSQLVSQVEDDIMFPIKNPYMALANVSDAFDDSLVETSQRTLELESQNDEKLEAMFGDLGFKDIDGGEELFELEFKQHKRGYYMDKFEVPVADDEFVSKIAYEYILAIQWNLHYYYNGIQSWSWYYPFHYSPYASDLVNISSFNLQLEKSKPFKPFEQLLAVLPSFSRTLLPDAFQSLMIMDTSPIIDYYPTEFGTDLNGKQQEWEAVVLIPFIEERRLLAAMAPHYTRLTDEEKERNSYGKCLKYRYSKTLNFTFPSTYPGEFNDIVACKASCEKIAMDEFQIPIKDVKKGLGEGVQLDVYFPGFPTLKHIPHHTELRKAGVKVFSYSSKSKNMIVSIANGPVEVDVDVMRETVGTVVYVEWPYMVEALVTAITDGERRFVLKQPENVVQEEKMTKSKVDDALFWMKNVRTNLLERKGIDPGEVSVLVEAKTLKGKRYVYGPKGKVSLEKQWADTHAFFPFQAVVRDLKVHTSMNVNEVQSVGDIYEPGSQCFMVASPHYGCSGEVLEIDNDASRVRVSLTVPPEPEFSDVITNQTKLSDRYVAIDYAARQVGISVKLLSRITGSLFVTKNKNVASESRTNLGLKLKFSGQNREVLGYARRDEDGWSFSTNAINVLRSYIQRFPNLFQRLSRLPEQECYEQGDIFPDKTWADSVEEVLAFLKSLPCRNIEAVKCGSKFLDEKIVCAIEEAVGEAKSLAHLTKSVKVKVKPYVLFKHTAEFGNLVPDPTTEYYLFDRVVNVRDNGAVPLGFRGTIIGVHEVKLDDKNSNSPSELSYEVLFDKPFLGGVRLRCEQNKGAYMRSSSLLNLSHGERRDALKKGYTPTNMTDTQNKAEPRSLTGISGSSSYGDFSPFSTPRRKGQSTENTPYGRPRESTPTYASRESHSGGRFERSYRKDGNRSVREDDLKSPDYWLKGYGREKDGYSSPNSFQNRESPRSKVKRNERKDVKVETQLEKSESDSDFQAMWKKMQDPVKMSEKTSTSRMTPPKKEDRIDSKVDMGQRNVNKEGTALLQKLLSIKSPQQQQQSDVKTRPLENPDVTAQHKKTSPTAPPMQANALLNQLFQSSSPSQPVMNNPASPTSPLAPGSAPAPSKDLQNWCYQNQMPAPQYTYSVTPQGVHAVVIVGPAICYGGLMCRNKAEAAESAAATALGHLVHRQAQLAGANPQHGPHVVAYPNTIDPYRPHLYMGNRPRVDALQIQATASQQQQRLPWNSPLQYIGGTNLRMQHSPHSICNPPQQHPHVIPHNVRIPQPLVQQHGGTPPHAIQSSQFQRPQCNSPLQFVGDANLRMQHLPSHLSSNQHPNIKHQHLPASFVLLQQLQASQRPTFQQVDPVSGHHEAQLQGTLDERSLASRNKDQGKDGRKDFVFKTENEFSETEDVPQKETEVSAHQMLAFIPLQVNRAGMRASKSSTDASQKEAVAKFPNQSPEVNEDEDEDEDLIMFANEKEEKEVPILSERASQPVHGAINDNVTSLCSSQDVVAGNERRQSGQHKSAPVSSKKDKPRKNILLAPNFFAPKKQ